MRARLVVRISPADVGRRVSVRARYEGPEASTIDVVGELLAWQDGVLTIMRRDGEQRLVNERDLLAGRVLADAAPPRLRRKPRPPT